MKRAIPPKDYIDAVDFPATVELMPIGVVRSEYRERHGTPRQATVGEPRRSRIELFTDRVPQEALLGMEGIEYLWVIAWLHLNRHWNPTVIPPRGPRVRRGVLSTRAPHRPNQLGLSATRLIAVRGPVLEVEGLDLLDMTPVLDIKPYIPYADAHPDASAGWVDELD
jgi:tRNA-Thr(GGU) m(6)t(6)A37 methyltransferase TsaA